jgi:phage repressor protein C with HTH and peptisase S24 domain
MPGVEKDAALITALVDYAGVSLTEVAKRAKVDPETLRKPVKGIVDTRLSQRTIEKLADAFPKFPGWTRAGAAALASFDEPDLVPVREIDLSFGMGATYLDVPITEEVHHFPRAWLRRYTRSAPDKLFFAQGIGDSMEPTLHDSDLLLIDTAQRQLTSADRIWVLTYADCGMIKRLRPVPGGGIEVWSDKKEVSPFTAYDGELEIIGRVVAVQRKL